MDPLRSAQNNKAGVKNTINVWIRNHFEKRECVRIVPTSKDSNKCGCGRALGNHFYFEGEDENSDECTVRWGVARCAATSPTDSFGTLSFQGVHSPNKSLYIRLDFATNPADIWCLLVDAWGIDPPKLVISVQGSYTNFELQQSLTKALQKGLTNAAQTTNAWIITSGCRAGAAKHVASALSNNCSMRKVKFTVIGITSWGSLKRSDELLNHGAAVPYYPQNVPAKSRYVSLCEGHTVFLLADNGTVGRTGGELYLRRRFEEYLKQRPLGKSSRRLPTVCLTLGGGRATIQSVLTSVVGKPPTPVVVCSGSGRAADMLSFAYKVDSEEQEADDKYKKQLNRMIEKDFGLDELEVKKIFKTISLIMKRKDLLTIFNAVDMDEQEQELDCSILNALLRDKHFSPVDQLSLLLTWNREDMAREIFEQGHDWPDGSLNEAMMFALTYDQVGFVKLLLSNGIAMDKFLTITRLEELYNTEHGPANTLRFVLQDVVIDQRAAQRYSLLNIGLIIEKLMGGGYRSVYCTKEFKRRYKHYNLHMRKHKVSFNEVDESAVARLAASTLVKPLVHFTYPFHDLFLWAVLTKRHDMAMCMWQHGEEPLAKALVGYKLNKKLAKEAEEDYFKVEICAELRANALAFKNIANDLLEQCYQTDDDLTFQLLTNELKQWSKKTCISLAALARHKSLLAHPCCQMLMADLWLGGLRIRKKAGVKVLGSILCPPLIFLLPFKTEQQLLYQPQSEEEFLDNRPGSTIDHDSDTSSSVESCDDEATCTVDVEACTEDRARMNTVVRRSRKVSRYRKTSVWTANNGIDNLSEKNLNLQSSNGDLSRNRPSSFAKSRTVVNLNAASIDNVKDRRLSNENCFCGLPESRKASVLQIGRRRIQSMMPFGLYNRTHHENEKIEVEQIPTLKRSPELSAKKKLQEFYRAPIASFWSNVLGYIFFLGAYTYTVLVQTTPDIDWPEYYVIAFILTFSVDQIRRVLLEEPKSLYSKLSVYSQKTWDLLSCASCLMFFIAFCFRLSDDKNTMMDGRVLYCCNIVFWYMRCLHLLTVSSALGPYIFMYGKMVVKMILLSTILFVIMASFGIVRQSIQNPYDVWAWVLLRNVVYKPYFMLYGEVYADDIDDCGDKGINCVPGFWLVPIFMTVYLLLSIIVFMNLMIASFNYVFIEVQDKTHLVWQIQRYDQVMEYERQPFTPPPFIILAHVYLLIKYIYRKIYKKDKVYHFQHSLKLYLSPFELDRVHDFEMICLKELVLKKQSEESGSLEDRLKQMNERIEALGQKIDDRYDQFTKDNLSMVLLNKKINIRQNSATPPVSLKSANKESASFHVNESRDQDLVGSFTTQLSRRESI